MTTEYRIKKEYTCSGEGNVWAWFYTPEHRVQRRFWFRRVWVWEPIGGMEGDQSSAQAVIDYAKEREAYAGKIEFIKA